MSRDESEEASSLKPTFNEGYMIVTARLMQGVVVLIVSVFVLVALWSVPDIVRRLAYLELATLLGFGAIFLGMCAAFWAIASFILKKTRAQVSERDRAGLEL